MDAKRLHFIKVTAQNIVKNDEPHPWSETNVKLAQVNLDLLAEIDRLKTLSGNVQRLKQAMHHVALILDGRSDYDWAWSAREILNNALLADTGE